MIKLVYITCNNEDEALKIGRILVEKKLAACVNMTSGIKSIYKWGDKIVEDLENILLVKTNDIRVVVLIKEVKNYIAMMCRA